VDQNKVILRELAAGRPVQIKGRGASMVPRIPEGDHVTVAPIHVSEVRVDDIVFVRIRRDRYLTHLVKDISEGRYLIGNNLGKIDGWVEGSAILGKVVRVGEDPDFRGVTIEELADQTED
jgi:hypothetical protein